MKQTSFLQINRYLLNKVANRKTKKGRLTALDNSFNTYQNKSKKNQQNYFKNETMTNNYIKYTTLTIKNKINDWIVKGKLNSKQDFTVLGKMLDGYVRRSRQYQKDLKRSQDNLEKIKNASKEKRFRYILTHNAKSHCECCLSRSGRIYNKKNAMKIQASLPEHNHCRCYLVEIQPPEIDLTELKPDITPKFITKIDKIISEIKKQGKFLLLNQDLNWKKSSILQALILLSFLPTDEDDIDLQKIFMQGQHYSYNDVLNTIEDLGLEKHFKVVKDPLSIINLKNDNKFSFE